MPDPATFPATLYTFAVRRFFPLAFAVLLMAAPARAADRRAEAPEDPTLTREVGTALVDQVGLPADMAQDLLAQFQRRHLGAGTLLTAWQQGQQLTRLGLAVNQYYWTLLYYFSKQPAYSTDDLRAFIDWSRTEDFLSAITRGREGRFRVSQRHHQMWDEMRRFWGAPYQWGGETPSGTDCSGFTQKTFQRAGIALPRVSRDQFKRGIPLRVEDLAPGDLVFFDPKRTGTISHVGIYLGQNRFAHSATSNGVAYSELVGDNYWWPAYRGARRLF